MCVSGGVRQFRGGDWEGLSNHFNYANLPDDAQILDTLCRTLSTLILNHYLESATLYCTLSHF